MISKDWLINNYRKKDNLEQINDKFITNIFLSK
ncbi:MAG: hypothetical protein QS2022_3040 [Candidatus Phytoplasma asteris]|nr:MAG: hypothetical protein PLY_3030 [Periwinkle leaf yellowing phytoplasma]WEX19564.1 MAG: hypothetical protein QS2022_3040 [Candidatus Phytoplasma asteris]